MTSDQDMVSCHTCDFGEGSEGWTGPNGASGFARFLPATAACIPGSVYDAISARIAEDLGFEVGIFSGSIGSMAVLGAPDLVVLTLSEFAAQAYRICRAGNLCLLVDADHGYGNALNVRRTVEELETSGVCALSIEDTVLPRALWHRRQADPDPGRGGYRQDEGGAVGAPGQEAGHRRPHQRLGDRPASTTRCKRAKAYEAAGVDAIFLAGGVTVEAIEAVSSEIRIPLITGGGAGQLGRSRLDGRRTRCGSRCRGTRRSAPRCRRSTTR